MNKQELNKIWKEIISSLKESFNNKNIYETCILPTEVIGIKNNVLNISVPSIFAKSILVNDFKDIIDNLIKEYTKTNLNIEFLLPEEKKFVRFDDNLIIDHKNNNASNGLIKDYTLDNFIVGEFNKSAYNAVCAIANRLGTIYNPLFIYGSTGLGKTHLIIALGNHYLNKYPNKKIKYIECDNFIRDVFSALSKGSNFVEELKNNYSSIDLLLIDDIQYLSGKEKTNEIFFSIFNSLVRNNRQIVITSDKEPDSLDSLEERMVSRFSSGLTIKINKPEHEVLKQIVLQKINQNESNIFFNDDAISEITKYYDKDLRKLIGVVNQLSFYAIQNLRPDEIITKEFVKKFVNENNSISHRIDLQVNPDIVIATICKWYGIKEDLVRGKSRLKNLVDVRHVCMYVLRTKLSMNYNDIGKLFSNRDHTTVMSAIEKIAKKIESDESLKKYIDSLFNK